MAIRSKARWCLALVGVVVVALAHASPITVMIGTGSLQGADAQLAFDLIEGSPKPNSVAITGFDTDGNPGSSNLPPSGGVSGGPLPADVTLTDTDFFNEYLQSITLGTYITFTFDASGSASDSSPAGFSFFILDEAGQASLVETGAPLQSNALFRYSIGNRDPIEIFAPFSNDVTVEEVTAVPEPGAFALVLAALLPLVFMRAVRKTPSRRALTA